MATYKISGSVAKVSTIYIIQDEEYKGKRNVNSGDYEIIFESESNSPVIAVAEDSQGQIMSFGNIEVLDAEGREPNLHKIAVVQDVIQKLQELIGNYNMEENLIIQI